MVPKVAGKGASFKGAALYYLHDKGSLNTSRVAFCEGRNLAGDDADACVIIMIRTAQMQQQLKAAAGGSARGRKLRDPVYTYSLSWAPEEAPTRAEMILAAEQTLVALGLSGHQALLIAHNDEPHPHIHVIVNRVHPETGIAAKLSNDHLKLSAWAEAYEKAQGLIRCNQRVENNRKRKNAYVKDISNDNSAAFYQWRRDRIAGQFQQRKDDHSALSAAHRAQRQALFAAKEHAIRRARGDIRAGHKHYWQAVYQTEKAERLALLFDERRSAAALRHFLRNHGDAHFHAEKQLRTGHLSAAFGDIVYSDQRRKDMAARHGAARTNLSSGIAAKQRAAFKEINDAYKADLDALKDRQRLELHDLELRQAAQSQAGAREIADGADRTAYLDEQIRKLARLVLSPPPPATRQFSRAAGDRPRPARAFAKAARDRVRPSRDFGSVSGQDGIAPRTLATAGKGGTRANRVKYIYRLYIETAREITARRDAGIDPLSAMPGTPPDGPGKATASLHAPAPVHSAAARLSLFQQIARIIADELRHLSLSGDERRAAERARDAKAVRDGLRAEDERGSREESEGKGRERTFNLRKREPD